MALAPAQHRFLDRPYSQAEIISDGAMHIIALVAALIGLTVLVMLTAQARGTLEVAAVTVYAVALVTMLGCSLAYNMIPVSPLKWLMRRFDHSGIFLLIAGTYTPLLTQIGDQTVAWGLGAVVWSGAIAGIVLAIAFPGRGERYKVAAYLALAWVAILAVKPLAASLSEVTMALMLIGGLLYSSGVVFYRWNSLRFQNVIWHGFVISAAACHFGAISVAMLAT